MVDVLKLSNVQRILQGRHGVACYNFLSHDTEPRHSVVRVVGQATPLRYVPLGLSSRLPASAWTLRTKQLHYCLSAAAVVKDREQYGCTH